jgi:hypothetical protein
VTTTFVAWIHADYDGFSSGINSLTWRSDSADTIIGPLMPWRMDREDYMVISSKRKLQSDTDEWNRPFCCNFSIGPVRPAVRRAIMLVEASP